MQKALTVSKRTRTETAIGSSAVSVPYASVALSREVLGDLAGREVLLIGAGKMSELAAHYLIKAGRESRQGHESHGVARFGTGATSWARLRSRSKRDFRTSRRRTSW